MLAVLRHRALATSSLLRDAHTPHKLHPLHADRSLSGLGSIYFVSISFGIRTVVTHDPDSVVRSHTQARWPFRDIPRLFLSS